MRWRSRIAGWRFCGKPPGSRAIPVDYKAGRIKSLAADKLAKIAGYFNVSVDHLLGKEEKPAAPKDGELVKDELIGFYGDVKEHLTEGDIEDIKTLMKLRAELNRSKE